jgi:hypothetical protein
MRQRSVNQKQSSERIVKDIRCRRSAAGDTRDRLSKQQSVCAGSVEIDYFEKEFRRP